MNNFNTYSYFAFKVHINQKDDLKIYKIYPEQKILCKPEYINGQNRCLLMVDFSTYIIEKYAFIYAKSQNSILHMYGDFYTMKYVYDEFLEDLIYTYMPFENAKYENIVNNKIVDFIFINNIENYKNENEYFYLNILSDSLNTIEIYVSSYNYNELLSNTNTKQFFALDKNIENKMQLNFLTQNALMINIVSLNGNGELYFNNKLYNLEDKNNKISFILNSNIDENNKFKLKNENNILDQNNNYNNSLFQEQIKLPEFVFYIEYYFRNSNNNLDKINLENKITYKANFSSLSLF